MCSLISRILSAFKCHDERGLLKIDGLRTVRTLRTLTLQYPRFNQLCQCFFYARCSSVIKDITRIDNDMLKIQIRIINKNFSKAQIDIENKSDNIKLLQKLNNVCKY